jgi:signal transduction histidine kinase
MFRNQPIKRKLTTVILLTSGVVLLLTCGMFLAYELVTFRQTMARNLSTLTQVIAANSTAALAFDNPHDAKEVLSALAADQHIVAAGLYDNTGTLFAQYPDTAPQDGWPKPREHDGYQFEHAHFVLQGPVANANRRLGTLVLKSDLGAMYERFSLSGVVVAVAMVLSCLVAFPLSNRLQRHISLPVLALADTAKAVSKEKDYSVRANKFGDDELGRLTDAFNDMLAQIQDQDSALRAREEYLRLEVIERKRAEEEVRALNASLEERVQGRTVELAEANKELESFSYSVSHDLRAPLRHVQGYVNMLHRATEGQLSEKAQRYLKTITEASVEMGHLIDDLLAFCRMGRTEITESRISLDEVVKNTILGLEMSTAGRNIVWETAPLPPALGDPSLLKQVLANLIGNAVKYSRGREPGRIAIGCAGEDDGRMILFVRDNGAGFDMRYADKLFGVFQRLHRAEEFEGTGIGLATVRRIVARHGGRVWAEGAINQGATFYFTLKRSPSAA